jgi:hypothetical protein
VVGSSAGDEALWAVLQLQLVLPLPLEKMDLVVVILQAAGIPSLFNDNPRGAKGLVNKL